MAVLLIGTLDTKGRELGFVRDILQKAGLATQVIDAGVDRPQGLEPDIPSTEVFQAAGTTLAAIKAARDRGRAVEAAANGVRQLALRLHAAGPIVV